MSKLCMLYNFAPQYRKSIFQRIDDEWDTDWYFGMNTSDIKGLDYSVLNSVKELPNIKIKGHWYWQKGAVALARKDYSSYFLLGDPFCLSSWVLALRLRLFHRSSKKLYFWTHGWYGKESRLTAIIKKKFFKFADGVFLYGNYAKDLMLKEGFNPKKLFVIHNSLDYNRQVQLRNSLKTSDVFKNHFHNSNPTLIFIGRLTKVKKLDLLLKAVALLTKEDYPVNVVLVGDGSEKEALMDQAEELGIKDSCWFYGACYDEAVNAELIYNADVCVAPGNVGLTAMHVMVFGTPVISHNDFKWQMPEFEAIKAGETGNFFEKDNINSLTKTIKNWLSTANREQARQACFNEIDTQWTPDFQMDVLRKYLKVM